MAQEATHTYMPDGRIITTYTTIPDKPNIFSTTPAEMQQIANMGGGVLSEIGKTTIIKPSAEFIEKEKTSEVTPKLAGGVSGHYVQSSSGVYVPVSKSVADLIATNNAKSIDELNKTTSAAPVMPTILFTTPVGLKERIKVPQTYTSSTTLEEQIKSNPIFKDVSKSAELSQQTVGQETWQTMENIRTSSGYQTAFMLKKMVTGEGIVVTGAGALAAVFGKYPEYQKSLQERWLAEQRAETYQMSKFGSAMQPDKYTTTLMHDVAREQFMQQKALEIIPPAAMWIVPDMIGKVAGAAITAGRISVTAAKTWAKIGEVVMGAGVAYGTSEAYLGLSSGTPAGYERASTGFIVGGFAAYGMKSLWKAAFPKEYKIQSYTMEHQMYSGESETLRGEFSQGYQNIQSIRYGSPAAELPKNVISDEAVFLRIRGYKTETLFTGDKVVNEFDKMIKFRIAEREGFYKPILQNINEIEVFYPKGQKLENMMNLGMRYYDTNIGKPDVFNAFTFEKTGISRMVNIAEWESGYQTIGGNIPVSTKFVKGTGYQTFQDEFKALLKNMVSDKSFVITEASYESFFLEPELRKPFTSFAAGKGTNAPIIYPEPTKSFDLFDYLGIRDITHTTAEINLGTGKIDTAASRLMENLKVYQKPIYDIALYDKPVTVLANYPPAISPTLIPPTIVGNIKPLILGIDLGKLKGETGLGLKPEAKEFTQPKLVTAYEPSSKLMTYPLPKSMPKLVPELRSEPSLELRAEPKLILEPKAELMMQPKMEMRLMPKLQMQLKMDMRADMLFKFKEKPEISWKDDFREWFSVGKKGGIGLGKKDKLKKEKFKIEPKSDWLSRIMSGQLYGTATNIPNTKLYRQRFKREFLGHPLGMFAGRMPTQEMIKEGWIWVR